MIQNEAHYEIHVHGDVPLRLDVTPQQLEEALKPLWRYTGATSLREGAASCFEEEPGLQFDPRERMLQMCWTVEGDSNFRQVTEDLCQGLNEIAREGAPIEVSYYDADEESGRDEFQLLFVGPTPEAILQAQRDLLVDDVVQTMERHFDASELGGVVAEIDKLFGARLQGLEKSLNPLDMMWPRALDGAPRTAGKRRLH